MHYIVTGPLSVLEHNEVKTDTVRCLCILNEVFWGLDLDKTRLRVYCFKGESDTEH